MATSSHIRGCGGSRRANLFLFVIAAAAIVIPLQFSDLAEPEGRVARVKPSKRPTIEAAFRRESYSPGDVARVILYSPASRVTMQVFRAGTERGRILARDEMRGTAVTRAVGLGSVRPGRAIPLRIGDWRTGFYFVKLVGNRGRIGYAPFVLRPSRLGEHHVAVVLPTYTWQAYNFRDDDGDGDEDTWYADDTEAFARLGRPYENRGVPPHYKYYDQPFLRWLHHTGRKVDYLSQSDLDGASGSALARAYELIVFPGHHEYVTAGEYDAITRFRNRGGNLMFLSANNFYWKVVKRGNAIWRIDHWRDLGRPEAALIGVQYIGNDDGRRRGPWIIRNAGAAPWLFKRTGLRNSSRFADAGIEIDRTASSSPRGIKVLADIPNLLGPGMTAQMTYYETKAGARVFAAGAFTLAGAVWWPQVEPVMANLWRHMTSERAH